MTTPSFGEIWIYIIGPLAGATLAILGNYLLEKRKEHNRKITNLQIVECVELVNKKLIDKESLELRPIAKDLKIMVPKAGPRSELIDVNGIYYVRFRIRNLSDKPIEKLFLISEMEVPSIQGSILFSIVEGANQISHDWKQQLKELLNKNKTSEETGWDVYPIPYLNPYFSTRHEVFLDLFSYLSLDKVKIAGSRKGVNFFFKKSNKKIWLWPKN